MFGFYLFLGLFIGSFVFLSIQLLYLPRVYPRSLYVMALAKQIGTWYLQV